MSEVDDDRCYWVADTESCPAGHRGRQLSAALDALTDLLAAAERVESFAHHESVECNDSVCACGYDDVESAFKEARMRAREIVTKERT